MRALDAIARFVEPRKRLEGPERRRARLVAAITLLMAALITVLALLKSLLSVRAHAAFPDLPLLWGAAVILIGLHFYARSGQGLVVAVWATYVVMLLVPAAIFVIDPGHVLAPAYLIVPAIIAAVLMPVRQATFAICAVAVVSLLMPAVTALEVLSAQYVGSITLVMIACGLVLVNVHYRERVEADRQARMRESERNFRELAENANDGIIVVQEGRIVFANQRAVDLSGMKVEELIGEPMLERVHPDYRSLVEARYRQRLDGVDVPSRYEIEVLSRNGEAIAVEVNAGITSWRGQSAELVAIRDIRARRLAEAQMRKLSSALQQAADAVMITDRDGKIEYVNPAFEIITGYDREEALGQTPAIVKSGRQSERFFRQLWECIGRGDVFTDVFINRRKDGSLYYEEKSITPLKNEHGRITHFIATGKDITERMRTQERLEYLAHHDSLTGLPNRVLFLDRLKQALARARWNHHSVALMFIDLDRFKGVNDTLGHDAGDELLRELSGRLKHSLRERDTVARLGGDEFAVLLDDMESDGEVADLADQLLGNFREPFVIEKRELFVTASMGISLFPADGETVGTLLKNADIAMYRAKDLGKNTYQFYSADMSMRAFERLTLETSLRRAPARRQFELHYQPQVDLQTGRVIGLEALLRWNHPDMGLVSPTEFVGLLEDTGLIVPVGRWVLHDACAQAQAWCKHIPPHWWVTVNVSGLQLGSGDAFLNTVDEVLAETGLDPGRLELEITESVLMHDTDRALATLEALNQRGVRLAIDDFGTGYSSLAYLKRFAIDTLKIDRTFVRDVPDDGDDRAIVRAIIALAHSLNLSVVAEGVETERQLDFLRHQGCEAAQGYLVSAPLPATDVPEFVHRWHARARRA